MKTRNLALIGVLTPGVAAAAQSSAGWLRYPSIAPDGKNIVFTDEGDLCTMEPDITLMNDYSVVITGKDQQPEAAVAELTTLVK